MKVKVILAILGLFSWAQMAQAQYQQRVGVYARVDVGCYGQTRDLFVSNFRKVGERYRVSIYQAGAQVEHDCYGRGAVSANVTIEVPRDQEYVDYNGYLIEPLSYSASATCLARSSWSTNAFCELDNRMLPPEPPHRPPHRPQPPIYEPPQPPHRPPAPPHRPPQPPPPVQGNPLVVNTEVEVGCRGRVAPVQVTNLTLVQDSGQYMTFRGYTRVAHKCGSTKGIAATVDVSIHRANARVNVNGVLLSPAVNASIQCVGQSDWVGTSGCRVVSQQ